MSFIDKIRKAFERDIVIFAGGYPFNLGRRPIVRTGISDFQEVCGGIEGEDRTCFIDVKGFWYNTEGPLLMDGPLVTDPESIRRLERIVRR